MTSQQGGKSESRSWSLQATRRRLKGLPGMLSNYDPSRIRNPVLRFPAAGLFHCIRFLYILGQEARQDQIWQRAAGLTYTSILSLFPLIILLSSMVSLFYPEEQQSELIDFIEARVLPPDDVGVLPTDQLVEDEAADEQGENVASALEKLRGSLEQYRQSAPRAGFAGFLALLITVYILYTSIESAFEAAWGESRHYRDFRRSITGFTFVVVLAPVVVGGSVTASSFFVSRFSQTPAGEDGRMTMQEAFEASSLMQASEGLTMAEDDPSTGTASVFERGAEELERASVRVIEIILGLLPLFLNALMLALAYTLIPRAKVKFHFAILGGLAAGLLWELAKVGFFYYIFMSASRRAIIQSLGAVPIFLIWIYFTWIVFLLGNHLTYVGQNLKKLSNQYFDLRWWTMADGVIPLALTMLVADAYSRGERGILREELIQKLRLTFEECDEVLDILRKKQIVTMTVAGRIIPARPPSQIYVRELLRLGCDPLVMCDNEELEHRPRVAAALDRIMEGRRDLLGEETLADVLGPDPDAREVSQSKRGDPRSTALVPIPEEIDTDGREED